jgi:2-polyprenyl-3-methyl-5-hydroxy-6-metoxy-1,4-benzoquinol methylase
MICKCCSFDGAPNVYQVKEMQLGLREIFDYQLCTHCGCMQLLNIPKDLAKYYPADNYYSFNTTEERTAKIDALRKLKASWLIMGKNNILGSLLSIGYKPPAFFDWLKTAKVDFDDAILDVGCGDGGLLVSFYKNGFSNLTGIDPFNPSDLDYGGFKIYKKDIFNTSGQYDFIMLNHVFEHMDQPKETLQKLYELLKPDSYLLIRTPVMGTYSWNKYKESWMGLDAPRHIVIHSEKSIQLLAEATGFQIMKTRFDGTSYTLIASEQYLQDVPLIDPNSYIFNKSSTLFSKKQVDGLERIAEENNAAGQGDEAAYFLYKA